MNLSNARRALRNLAMLATVGIAACSASTGSEKPKGDPQDPLGYDDDSLTALATACTYDPATNFMTVTIATGETAIISKRAADSAILQNGATCNSTVAPNGPVLVTATALKKITVTGSGGADTLILDFTNGVFATGTSSASASGIVVDMGAGSDKVGIKGTTGADNFVLGAGGGTPALLTNTDLFKDVMVTGAETWIVSLGDGDDVWSAGGNATAGAVFGAAVTVYGGAGNDTFNQGTAVTLSETLSGGAGTDTVSYASRTAALTMILGDATATDGETGELDDLSDDIEVVNGGSGNDSMGGTASPHTFNGNDGDDTFNQGATTNGAEVLNGGNGIDTVDYSARSLGVTVTMDGVAANDGEGGATEGDNVKADVENCKGSSAADNITGGPGNNTITGGLGADTLSGGAGDDVFVALAATDGADIISGGTGSDTMDYRLRTAAITATLDGATTSGLGGGSEGDILGAACAAPLPYVGCTDVENIWGGTAADVLTGNGSANELVGGTGNDTLSGGAGDDVLEGGGGTEANVLDCGSGDGDTGFGQGSGGAASRTNCEF
ncbi:MAG: calcium-binding protein [Polyangiaceae bacterium]|nr:calcium-binding protein [Polyangiaceae bacterium]